jgi:hypothetical protein
MPELTHSDSAPDESGDGSPRPDLESSSTAYLEPATPPTPHQQAARTLNQLRAALAVHGVSVPSLGLDVLSLSQPHTRPLIELGRINLGTARLLTRALGGAAEE